MHLALTPARRSGCSACGCAVLLCLAALPARALAQGPDGAANATAQPAPASVQSPQGCAVQATTASADRLEQAGKRAMARGSYAAALDCFGRAHALRPDPKLRYNLARAHELAGHPVAAYQNLAAFLRTASDALKRRVAGLDELASRYAAQVALVRLTDLPPGAEVRVDGEYYGTAPLEAAVAVAPGSQLLEVSAPDGRSFRAHLAASAGQQLEVEVELGAPLPPQVAPADGVAMQPLEVSPWIALGVGVAGGVFAGVSYGLAASVRGDICDGADGCTRDVADLDAADTYDTWRTSYHAGLVIGVVGLAAGGVLWLLQPQTGKAEGTSLRAGREGLRFHLRF